MLRAARYGKQPARSVPGCKAVPAGCSGLDRHVRRCWYPSRLADSRPMGRNMLFKKLFQVLVVGGAVMGAVSGCATTSGASDSTDAKAPPPAAPPPPSGMGGGARGW